MRKFARACAVFGAGTTILMMAAAPALAWSGSGGTGSGSATLALTDSSGGGLQSCSSAITIAAKEGSGLSGTGIASVTSLNEGSIGFCNPLNASFGASSLPWSVNGTTYSSGVTTGTITGVTLFIDQPIGLGSCLATIQGTVAFAYNNGTGQFVVQPDGSLLKVTSRNSNCSGWIIGSPVSWNSTYTLSPKISISNP